VVQTLHPAYFALVMATGIVAISAFLEGLHTIAVGLSWFNAVAFILLCVIYLRVWFSIHVLFFETL
jgi:hypothetical protein